MLSIKNCENVEIEYLPDRESDFLHYRIRDSQTRSERVEIWQELSPKLKSIESALRTTFDSLTTDIPTVLREAMAHSLFAGGKRLRPLLCGLACEAVGGTFGQALTAGCAVEMIHTYSLIHDDLPDMDDDDLRRGRPTCHKVFGNALAILAGDGLQSMAFELLANDTRSIVALAHGAGPGGMVGGQVLDLIEDGRVTGDKSAAPIDRLEAIHRRKTGALFRASLKLGAYAAGRIETDTAMTWLDNYAKPFGLLFQVTDDLLDVEGHAAVTGKATGKDSERGKLTYPGLIGIENSRQTADDLATECETVARQFGERGFWLGALARSMVRRKA